MAADGAGALQGPALDAALAKQIEFYFSLGNLASDVYLWDCMDSAGFVSIALIASFKKLAKLSTDLPTILRVMKASKALVVSPDDTRVRAALETMLPRNTVFVELAASVAELDAAETRAALGLPAHVPTMGPAIGLSAAGLGPATATRPSGATATAAAPSGKTTAAMADSAVLGEVVEIRHESAPVWTLKFADEPSAVRAVAALAARTVGGTPLRLSIVTETLYPPQRSSPIRSAASAPIFFPAAMGSMPMAADMDPAMMFGGGVGTVPPYTGPVENGYMKAGLFVPSSQFDGMSVPYGEYDAGAQWAGGYGGRGGAWQPRGGRGGPTARRGGRGGERGGTARGGSGSAGGAYRTERRGDGASQGVGMGAGGPARKPRGGAGGVTGGAGPSSRASGSSLGGSQFTPAARAQPSVDIGISNFPPLPTTKGAPKSAGYTAAFVRHPREAILAIIHTLPHPPKPHVPHTESAVIVPKGNFTLEFEKPIPDASSKRKVKAKPKHKATGAGADADTPARGRSGSAGAASAHAGAAHTQPQPQPQPHAHAHGSAPPAAAAAEASASVAPASAATATVPASAPAPVPAPAPAVSAPVSTTAAPAPAAAAAPAPTPAAAPAANAVAPAAAATTPAPAAAPADGKKPSYADLLRK